MNELKGDLWQIAQEVNADAVCITTNCTVNPNGTNPMGGGCAAEAAQRFPELPLFYGMHMLNSPGYPRKFPVVSFPVNGNSHLRDLEHLLLFPVKYQVWEAANIHLVCRSAVHLKHLMDEGELGLENVLLPRPGCGLGGLEWSRVKEVLERVFEDTPGITVVSYPTED